MHSTSETMGINNVPAFLTKIWTLVDDPSTDELIAWDPSGVSFHVFDQARFAKEILPLYFKHSNIASFIRQLNMYGFRKVVHVDSGSIKCETDDVEFQHPYFRQGEEALLEHIKRKASGQSAVSVKTEPGLKLNPEDVTRVLTDVQTMKGKQETFTGKIDKMKKENDALWREVASLRQKHMKQQQIVNKLIQFMIHLVGGKRGISTTGLPKRKMPLMINDASQVPPSKRPRHSRQLSIDELQNPHYDYSVKSPPDLINSTTGGTTTGPVIHDVTDTLSPLSDIASSPCYGTTVESPNISALLPDNTTTTITNVSPANASAGTVDILGQSLDSSDLSSLIDISLLHANDTSGTSKGLSDSNASNLLERYMKDNPIQERMGSTPVLTLPSEMTGQLDTMQDEIDNLKDLLSGGQYNFDPSTVMTIFNGDNGSVPPMSIENLLGDVDSLQGQAGGQTGGPSTSSMYDAYNITGNELVQFQPSVDNYSYPDLSDIYSDEASQEIAGLSQVDPMSFINTTDEEEQEAGTTQVNSALDTGNSALDNFEDLIK